MAPVVAHLLTDECTDTGTVLVAGGGRVQQVAQFASKGATFPGTPTLQDVADRWPDITDMDASALGTNPLG